jgi:non-ribosomal peptide synthetase component F
MDLIVCLLGILKAGAAYLPLDPEYPKERLAYMLADAQPEMVVTSQSLLQKITGTPSANRCLSTAHTDQIHAICGIFGDLWRRPRLRHLHVRLNGPT